MPTTTNYGWTTPADTDLVKDGASAIRTLASGVDTTVKNLNPGTTAGDIDYYTSSTAKARVAIGTAGQVLRVNSGATAPEWHTPTTGAYTLINTGGTTLTGATVTISSIPATYTDLYILAVNFKPATDNTDLVFYINGDSGTKYVRAGAGNDSGTGSFGDTNVNLATNQDNGTGDGQASLMIRGYTLSTWKMFFANSITNDFSTATNVRWATNIGATNITAAISSITFLCASGNFTSGTVYVYGVK